MQYPLEDIRESHKELWKAYLEFKANPSDMAREYYQESLETLLLKARNSTEEPITEHEEHYIELIQDRERLSEQLEKRYELHKRLLKRKEEPDMKNILRRLG